jgi:hypothetical protein
MHHRPDPVTQPSAPAIRGNFSGGIFFLLCAALATLAGALSLFLLSSEARAAQSKVEAETMSLSGSPAVVVRSSSAASGGQEVAFFSNGSASRGFDGAATNITLYARGQSCRGNPQLKVYVDDALKGTVSPTTSSFADYSLALGGLSSGTHTLRISFDNDYYRPNKCDRNAYLDYYVLTLPDSPPPSSTNPVLVGAGDIATGGLGSDADKTAQLVEQVIQQRPDTVVFTTGDNAYPDGSVSDFQNKYHPTWGRFKSRTNPTTGNHEYLQVGAKPYFDYFGAAARPGASNGNYSYELGSWHIIALNSGNCTFVASDCAAGSTMIKWLEADLAANNKRNVLAYMHQPLFSSDSAYGDSQTYMRTTWERLYAEGADIVITGHAHDYERFAPQTPSHAASPSGIREFVVGTGGTPLRGWGTISANSQFRDNTHHGVLKLTLRDSGYDWQFLAVGGSVPDSGSASVN